MRQGHHFGSGPRGGRGSGLVLSAFVLCAAARAAEFPVCTEASAQSAVDAASAGEVLLVVWQDERDLVGSGVNVYGALVSSTGAVVPPGEFAISTAAGNQTCPRVASDGTGFLVVWQDDQAGALELDIYAVTVAADTTVGAPFVVSAAVNRQKYPDVAWTGSYYVVAWEDERAAVDTWDIFAARVLAAGGVHADDAGGIQVTSLGAEGSVAVAGGGDDALLVFRHGGASNDILGAIVDSTGAAATFAVASAFDTQKSPCAAFGNGIFLAAWEDNRLSGTGPEPVIYVARIDPAAGSALDNVWIGDDTASRSATPAVAFDGEDFVVAWEEGSEGAADIFFSRVAADSGSCTVREPGGIPAVTGAADMDAPSLARTGFDVIAAWTDYRNTSSDIYAIRVATDDPPTAGTPSASPPTATEVVDVVTLSTSGEVDPEGLALTYEWTQTAGPGATFDPAAESPTFTAPDEVADYSLTFELRVSDGVNWSAPASVTIPVLADDDPPVANAGADYAVATLAQAYLDGGASYDPEGGPLTYSWTEVSAWGVEIAGADQCVAGFVAPDVAATLDFELTVSDGVNEATDAVQITVSVAENPPPAPSNVGIGTLTADSANVIWDTDLAAFGSVRYGTTPALGTESPQEGTLETSHAVLLAGLRSGATYHYVVRSEGANCAWTLSAADTFTTDPPSSADDTDLDGMPDAWEAAQGLDLLLPSDADADADPDGDKLSNLDEYRHGTDVLKYDTDGDGGSDGYEVLMGFDPARPDSVPPPEPPVMPSGGSCSPPAGGSPPAAGRDGGTPAGALAALALLLAALAARARGAALQRSR